MPLNVIGLSDRNYALFILDKDQDSKEAVKNELHFTNGDSHSIILCLQEKGEIVGEAALIKTNDCIEIIHLYVPPQHREKGIGKNLLRI